MMPLTLLAEISSRIESGSPLWAMLTANEYLERTSHLRVALATKARAQISPQIRKTLKRSIIKNILDGKTVRELPAAAITEIRKISNPETTLRHQEIKAEIAASNHVNLRKTVGNVRRRARGANRIRIPHQEYQAPYAAPMLARKLYLAR